MPRRRNATGSMMVSVCACAAALAVLAVSLWVAPRLAAGQDTESVIAVVYADGTNRMVSDWRFAYEFLESDTPLDPAYIATCTRPSHDENSCFAQVKITRDLILIGTLPGPSDAARAPFLLPEVALRGIRIQWRGGPGPNDGVRLNPDRNDGRYLSDALTVVTSQGAQILFAGRLEVPESFLSDKRHVYLMKLSVVGSVPAQGTPGRFELRLDERLPQSSLKERVEEIRFR